MRAKRKALDYATLHAYGGRKRAGRLSVFVDLSKNPPQIVPVPREIEHKDFAPKLTTQDKYPLLIPYRHNA